MAQQTACRCLTDCPVHRAADQILEALKDALDVLYRVPDCGTQYINQQDYAAYGAAVKHIERLLQTIEGQTDGKATRGER